MLTVQLFFDSWQKTGNVAESARHLGLSKWTCYAWIRRKDLPRKQRAQHPGKQRYLQLRAEGMSRREAAAEVGAGLTAAGVDASVVAPERELHRWFPWQWYWADGLVDGLVGEGRIRRVDGHVTTTA